ncbi:MAG: ribosome biogenesis GTPase Der [Verrucomicrobiota bacterium]|nr:ribosome biogenesis GTPase Der [Verrucomicrobiota bacterium]
MIDPSRIVALVGRPNVGKSRLFNRLCGKRMSIVHDLPGVTRDLISTEIKDDYLLLDTGGVGMELEMTPKAIAAAAEDQVEFALQASRVVLFVVDVRSGVTTLDEMVADKLRRYGKQVLLIANKVDSEVEESAAEDFARLGLGDPIRVSAEHGRGIQSLEAALTDSLGPKPEGSAGDKEKPIRISLVGRPNVGKSSLGNALLNSTRLIVSDVTGTTRDSVESDLDYAKDRELIKFRLADTAGIRSKRKVGDPVEYFSNVRTQHSIERSDVVFLVIDAADGVTKQDQALAGDIMDAGKAIVIVVNKYDKIKERWDEEPVNGFKNLKHFLTRYETSLRKQLFFLPDPPVLFVSALKGFKVESLLEAAAGIEASLDMQLPTGRLNRLVQDLFTARMPKMVGIKRFKVFYAVQTGSRPLRLRFYCNRIERLDPTYRRYLEKGQLHEFQLKGCPIRFVFVGKHKRDSEGVDSKGVHCGLAGRGAPRQSREIQDKHRRIKQGDKAFEKKHPEQRTRISQVKAAHNKGIRKFIE